MNLILKFSIVVSLASVLTPASSADGQESVCSGKSLLQHAGNRSASSRRRSSTIPKILWVTGRWANGSSEMKKALNNLKPGLSLIRTDQDLSSELSRAAGQQRAEEAFLALAPKGTKVRYLDDAGMEEMTKEIAHSLECEGVHDIVKAYHAVRPVAFKADLWRLLVLWAHGGVYLDVNLKMHMKFAEFINFAQDKMVLVTDSGAPQECLKHGPAIWNAVMASSPRNKYLLASIKAVVQNINSHSYGCTTLDVTGPTALANVITAFPDYRKDIRMEYEFRYPAVRKLEDLAGQVLCDKDESLHDDRSKNPWHYDPLWNNHQVYCDEKGPDGSFC